MMNRKRRLILQAGVLAFIPILSTVTPQAANAQYNRLNRLHRGAGPTIVAGEVLLYCQPHTAQADVQALAAIVGAQQTVPLLLADAYKLVLPAAQQTEAATVAAVAALKPDARVRWVSPNLRGQRFQTVTTLKPNDKRYSEQWNLPQINMPAAWALQLGTANVADIDTGVDQTIADLTTQFLADSYNIADGNTNITAGPYATAYPDAQHGVGTSGVMIAKTNNTVGIASVCGWGTTKCLFLKDAPGVTDTLILDVDVNALVYILAHQAKDNVAAINISWGYGIDPNDTTSMLYQAVKNCTDAGIIVAVSAGNEATNDTLTNSPQGYPFVVTVGATGPTAKIAVYSSFGKVDIAAPGGDPSLGGTPDPDTGATFGATTDSVLTTWDGDYHYVQGTSFSAPHVAAVATLLMSVPGVTSKQVFDPNNRAGSVLLNTANHTISGQTQVPDQYFGYGIVDAYAALQKVSTNVTILNPIGINPATGQSSDPLGLPPAPIETLRPAFSFQIRNIPLANVNIVLQQTSGNVPIITGGQVDPAAANLVTNFQVTGTTSGSFPLYQISFRYLVNTTLPSVQQTITITGQPTDPTQPVVTDSRVFTIAPHQFSSGLSMVSIPYYESNQDSPAGRQRTAQELLGITSVTLYRWTNVATIDPTTHQSVVRGTYAANSTDTTLNAYPADATLQPSDEITTLVPDPGIPDVAPIGVGYFLSIPSGALVRTYGQDFPQNLVRVPLHEGWNLVGDPFPFPVSFAASEIETPDGNRYAISDAVQQNLLLPFIYRYISGSYQLQQLPNGTYEAWESHWIYVVPKNTANFNPNNVMTLLIPPTQAASSGATRAAKGRAATTAGTGVTGPGSWELRLMARSKDLVDGYNYIGMSSNATDGNDLTKAPKPPLMSPYVSLGMARAAGAGLYAQDLRPIGGTKTWDVVVNTDQKEADITVQWPNIAAVPKRYSLTLTDLTSGQTFDMRSLPAYQFHATAAEPTRKLTITAEPALGGGRAVLSNLFVNQATGRGVGQTIYDINYSLSRAASVDVTVLGSTGRIVGRVQPSRAATVGANHAYWDGRDTAGRTLPGGAYVLQVRAQTPDGQVTRQIQTLTITR
jgi:subtilisin family serine protease